MQVATVKACAKVSWPLGYLEAQVLVSPMVLETNVKRSPRRAWPFQTVTFYVLHKTQLIEENLTLESIYWKLELANFYVDTQTPNLLKNRE